MLGLGNKKRQKKSGASLVASNVELRGELHFHDQLLVDGKVDGSIYADPESASAVTGSHLSTITGTIKAPNVYINGRVDGSVFAYKVLVLGEKARISGDVYYKLIRVDRGAEVNGALTHLSRLSEADLAAGKKILTPLPVNGKARSKTPTVASHNGHGKVLVESQSNGKKQEQLLDITLDAKQG